MLHELHGVPQTDKQEASFTRHRDWLREVAGEDCDELVHEVLIPFCAAFLDQGFCRWSLPERTPFFQSFRRIYGSGLIERGQVSTTVANDEYTVFFRRIYDAGSPSVNELIIVPGDGAGIQHDWAGAHHRVEQLESVVRLFYVLVSSQNGGLVSDADMLNIANAFLANVESANAKSTVGVSIEPGQNIGRFVTTRIPLAIDFICDGGG